MTFSKRFNDKKEFENFDPKNFIHDFNAFQHHRINRTNNSHQEGSELFPLTRLSHVEFRLNMLEPK